MKKTRVKTWRKRFFRLYHNLYTGFLILVSIAALFLFYAGSAGLPRPLVRRIEKAVLTEYDVDLEIRKVRWRFPFTVLVQDVDYYVDVSGDQRGAPFISVKQIDIPFHPVTWMRGGWPVSEIMVTNGVLRLPSYEGCIKEKSRQNITLTGVHGEVGIRSNRVLFSRLEGELNHIDFYVKGTFDVPDERDRGKSLYDHWTGLYFEGDSPIPAWVPEAAEQLNLVQFNEGFIQARFALHPLVLHSNSVVLKGLGTRAECRGVDISDWRFNAALTGPVFSISNTVIKTQGGSIDLLTTRNFTNDMVYLSLGAGMKASDMRRLIPKGWNDVLTNWDMSFGPRVAVTVKAGPSDIDQVSDHVSGSLALDSVHYYGITEQQVRATFELDEDMLWISRYQSQVISTNGPGRCNADGMLYFQNRSLVINFHTAFYPDALLPACPAAVAHLIEEFDFSAGPPFIDGRLTGRWDQPESLRYVGKFAATNFSMDRVPINKFTSDLTVTNDYVELKDICLARDEGNLHGNLRLPLGQDVAQFDITSRVNPKAVADLISEHVSYILEPFEFKGESDVFAYGSVDYSAMTQMNFSVDVTATNMSVYMLEFSQAQFSVIGTGDEYRVSHVDGQLYGGHMNADMVFFPVEEDHYRYNVTAAVEHIEFEQLLRNFGRHPDELPREIEQGVLQGDILLSGLTGSNWLESVVARGHVVIDKGCLLQIPLFGPLSRFLSKMVPNLGCLAQTEFTCDYSIQDGVLHIKNGRLYGNVISINLSGSYGIANEALDIKVQVKLLRDNILAKLVNLITYPITKIFLEFHLGGTLQDPDWRPVNVPKELYLDFN